MLNVHDFKNLLIATETGIPGSRGKRGERRGDLRRNRHNQVANEGQSAGWATRKAGEVKLLKVQTISLFTTDLKDGISRHLGVFHDNQ